MESKSPPAAGTPAAAKKITVFTPSDIKKIGLDKMILTQIKQGVKKVVTTPDGGTKTLTPLKHSFCANLKMKMQKALQENKGTVVASPKKDDSASDSSTPIAPKKTPLSPVVRKFVIIKSHEAKKAEAAAEKEPPTVSEGKKIKVMQNQVIGVSPVVPPKKVKCYDNANPPRKQTIYNGSPSANKPRAFLDLEDDDEEIVRKPVLKRVSVQNVIRVTPSFTKPPIHTYKRKRAGDEEEPVKKIKPEEVDEAGTNKSEEVHEEEYEEEEVEEIVISHKKTGRKSIIEQVRDDEDGDITWTEIPPAKIPKKRGRKSKAELEALAKMHVTETPTSGKMPKKRGRKSKAELALIARMKTQEQDEDEEMEDVEEEDVEYITLEVSPSAETKDEDSPPPKVYKKRGRKSKAELAELALLAKQREEEEPSEYDDEDDEDEERISAAVSPTRHGRIPKRNKLFDNYVTPMRKRSISDAEAPKKTPKVTPKVTTGKKRGRKPKNWKPEDDEEADFAKSDGETVKDDVTDGASSNDDDNAMVDLDMEQKSVDTTEKTEDEDKDSKAVKVIKESSILPKKRGWKPSDDEEAQTLDGKEKTKETCEVTQKNNESSEESAKDEESSDVSKTDAHDAKKSEREQISEDSNQDNISEASEKDKISEDSEKDKISEDSEKDKISEDSEKDKISEDSTTEQTSEDSIKEETVEIAKEESKKNGEQQAPKDDKDAEEEDEFKGCFVDATPVQYSPRRRGRPKGSGRGGKRNATLSESNDADQETTAAQPQPDGDGEQPKVKRRGRKRTAAMMIEESPSTSAADGVDEPSKRRKAEDDVISNENVADLTSSTPKAETTTAKMYRYLVANLVVSIRHTMATSVELPKSPDQTITCAICKHHFIPNEWKVHKQRHHNNVAWSTTEKPLELDNHYIVMAALQSLYPAKPFFCEICNDCKKSPLGYLTHRISCSKSPDEIDLLRLQCSLCPKRILPHQIGDHENYHKKLEAKHKKYLKVDEQDDATPRKRTAARKASEMIQRVSKELSTVASSSELTIRDLKSYFAKNNYNNPSVRNLVKQQFEADNSIQCLFPSCAIKFESAHELFDHMFTCKQQPQPYFLCKLCIALFTNSGDIKKHLNSKHGDFISKQKEDDDFKADADDTEENGGSGDDVDSESGDRNRRRKERRKSVPAYAQVHANASWKLLKFSKLQVSRIDADSCPQGINYLHYAKTLEFCKSNYNRHLFPNYPFAKASWVPVNKNFISQYLPRTKVSIAIGQLFKDKVSADPTGAIFSRYKLFQTAITNGIVNIYCGGSISSMAWAPTNYDDPLADQILAVAVHPDPQMRYVLGNTYVHKSIIQLWNFGALNNKRAITQEPTLDLCIAHNYGGIFNMEWCPSGCYEVDGTRLGLLMVCSTGGYAYCYSIGQSNLLIDKIFKSKPVFKLVATSKKCDINFGMTDYFPVRVSWTNAAEHKYVAVGYSNGTVAMFNLQTKSELLKSVDEDNIKVFYPYMVFKADNNAITALKLNHLSGGNRYLTTCSATRMFKFWDLYSSNMRPVISTKRSCAHQMIWPLNSITVLNCNDTSSSNTYLTSVTTALVEFDYVHPTSMMYSHAAVRSISGTDWGGVIYQANEAGEVCGVTYRDMYPFIMEVPCKKFICSNASIVPVNEEDEDELAAFAIRNTYKLIQAKHKILFHDYNMTKPEKIVKQERLPHALSTADPSKYAIQAATVTCTNNNRYSFLFTAVGYNIGFVRVYHSNFLNVS